MTPHPLALLFDLDGTMVNTDHLHLQAYNTLLARFDRQISIEYYKTRIMGFSSDEIMQDLFPALTQPAQHFLSAEKESLFRASLRQLTPIAGLTALLDWAQCTDTPIAVVTNAPRENAMLLLQGLGLAQRFQVIIIGDELAHGKPHPLPYLTALEHIGANAKYAVAFEDSLSGVRSASTAGIATFGMLTSLPETRLRAAGAFEVLMDFQDPKLNNFLHTWIGKTT